MLYSTSRKLIQNTTSFFNIKHYTFVDKLLGKKGVFYGWGRKKSGAKAIELAKKHGTSFVLLEDGFIRSVGLGVEGSPSFSIVEDDVGIYYDATVPSRLEELLNSYDFAADTALMADARRAIALIKQHNISKYNSAPDVDEGFCIKYGLAGEIPDRVRDDGQGRVQDDVYRVLIIAQTAGDASLAYGMPDGYTTDEMITAAIEENPGARVYLKIHPDVLSGKKKSDIDIESAKKRCTIIEENVNPVSLLKYFDKVYTKTSGMGFEALLAGCECVCFGMPFYAGWGITDDRSTCERRKQNLTVEEVFAAAYILYTRYHNPYTNKPSNIFDTIETIVKMRRQNIRELSH
ncbi:MAG: hypothetical protein WC163_05750 [Sulfurovum sp.]|jgi:capsule polysaccharide export protein KpsC/LpsZ